MQTEKSLKKYQAAQKLVENGATQHAAIKRVKMSTGTYYKVRASLKSQARRTGTVVALPKTLVKNADSSVRMFVVMGTQTEVTTILKEIL